MKINEVKRRKDLIGSASFRSKGKEWRRFLAGETKNSLAAENLFLPAAETEELVSNDFSSPPDEFALAYFHAARFLYELAYGYRSKAERPPYKVLMKTVHSLLSSVSGEKNEAEGFRSGPMRTADSGTEALPDPTGWIDFWIGYLEYVLHNYSVFSAVSRIHSLFLNIRPFYRHNETVGRLMVNFILISRGYLNVSLEASNPDKKNEYAAALKKSGNGIRKLFKDFLPDVDVEEGAGMINEGNFSEIEEIFYDGMIESMNYFLVASVPQEELMTVREASNLFKISETAVKKRILSGSMVASKLGGNTWKIPQKYIVFRRSLRNRNPIW